MKQTGTASIGEPLGGADGREVGRERNLQRQLDEISTGTAAREIAPSPKPRTPTGALSERLWAAAEEICERQGLHPLPMDATPSPESGPTRLVERSAAGSTHSEEASRRVCPRCGHTMNRPATLCGYCWLRVAPMGADGIEPEPLPIKRPWWKLGK